MDLRALIGFLLADADDVIVNSKGRLKGLNVRPTDVKPSWFIGDGKAWVPRTRRRRRALYAFYDPVGSHLAHVAVKALRHPGAWPLTEAMLVVFEDLERLQTELADCRPLEAKRFETGGDPLRATLTAARNLDFQPYPLPNAERTVSRARSLLRTQLGWPSS
jgi:hypothetical protein